MQEARFAGACQDQRTNTQGWPGERKSIGATNREKAIEPRLQGLGPGLPGPWARAWGRGLQKLRAGPSGAWGPDHQSGLPKQPFRRSEKSPARRKAKEWAGQTCEAEARREEAAVATGR